MADVSDLRENLTTLVLLGCMLLCPWLPASAPTDTFERKIGHPNWYRLAWLVPLWYGVAAAGSYLLYADLTAVGVTVFHLKVLADSAGVVVAAVGAFSEGGGGEALGVLSAAIAGASTFQLAAVCGLVVVGGGSAYLANRYAEAVRYWRRGRDNYLLPLEEIYSVDEENGRRDPLVTMPQDQSVLLVGNSQSGKTSTVKLLMEQFDQDRDDAYIVLDVKGVERATGDKKGQYQEILEEKGYDYVQLSLRDSDVHWNVFREAPIDRPEEWDEAFQRVAKALFYEEGDRGQNQFFHEAAQQVFKGILLHLMRQADEDMPEGVYPSNKTLVEFCNKNSPEELEAVFKNHEDLKPIAAQVSGNAQKMAYGVYAHVQQQVAETFVGSFKEPGNFSIREYMQDPQDRKLLLNMPQQHGDAIKPLYRFFVDWSVSFAVSRSRVDNPDAACYYVLDEFSELPTLDRIDTLVNRGLEFNVRSLVGLQSIGQLRGTYGEETADSIVSGFSNLVLLDPGPDQHTQDFILDTVIGKRRYERDVYRGKGRFEILSDEQETVVEERYPVSDGEINAMDSGDAFLITRARGYIFGNLYELEDVKATFDRAKRLSALRSEAPSVERSREESTGEGTEAETGWTT